MEQFLTAVTKDVDAYWTKTFKASGLPEPRVGYKWIPAGQTAASACGDADGTLGDSAAAYCPGDDTIYISEKFATEIYDGTLDQALPGQLAGLRQDDRRLLGRLHRGARVRARGPGQARPLRPERRADPDDGVRAPGRLLRRHVGEERLQGEPSPGRRRAGGPRRGARRRRLRHLQPEPSRHARAARRRMEQRLRVGDPSSCSTTWTRPTSTTAPARRRPATRRRRTRPIRATAPATASAQQQAAYEHRGVAAVRG